MVMKLISGEFPFWDRLCGLESWPSNPRALLAVAFALGALLLVLWQMLHICCYTTSSPEHLQHQKRNLFCRFNTGMVLLSLREMLLATHSRILKRRCPRNYPIVYRVPVLGDLLLRSSQRFWIAILALPGNHPSMKHMQV